jgi:hypothetical protein
LEDRNNNIVRIIGYTLIVFYLLGLIFPDLWWGTNYFAFLPEVWKSILLLASFVILLLPYLKGSSINFRKFKKQTIFSKFGTVQILAFSIFMAVLFYYFQIYFDEYGDAFQYRIYLQETASVYPKELSEEIFSFNFLPSSGRKTVLLFYSYLSYVSGSSFEQVFKWMGVICGFGYIFSWLLFVKYYLKRFSWQIIMSVIGILAPFTQIYYGHTESYALVFTLFISWVLLLMVFYKNKNSKLLWFLLVLLLICLKVHPLCFFLLPVWILSFLYHKFHYLSIVKKILTWRGVCLALFIPFFCLGIVLYFFVLKDYNDPRFLIDVKDADRLFLPLLSPESPLDRYNLLSWNHLFDYFNMFISWSSAAIFIIAGIIVNFRKKINWNAPEIIVLGSLFILCSSLLFMINPLVSMPMDWDLFSFSAPILIIIVVILLSKVEFEMSPKVYLPVVLVLLILSSPFFIVNSSKPMLANRLASVGVRVFESYYLHSNRIIINALNLQPSMEDYLSKKEEILEKLKPYALQDKDPLYANLLMDDGYYYLNIAKDYNKAKGRLSEAFFYYPSTNIKSLLQEVKTKSSINQTLFDSNLTIEEHEKAGLYLLRDLGNYKAARDYFEKVLGLYPKNPIFIMYAMESCFLMGEYDIAYYYATGLVLYKYPDEKKSYRIATHCALEAKKYKQAEIQAAACIIKFPEDELMVEVHTRLVNKDSIDQIRLLFMTKE